MNRPDDQYVYHGSHESFDVAIPKRQVRKRVDDEGNVTVIFDDISFHATPYKWIALNYTCQCQNVVHNDKEYWVNTGLDLKKHVEEITVYGVESLEKSLDILYGQGGYLFTFDKNDFITKEGLGALEMISQSEIKPISIERIDDPVSELRKLGITFKFVDETKGN